MSLAEVAVKYGFTTKQDVDLVRSGWNKFPVSRPVERTKIKVLIDDIEHDGIAVITPDDTYTGITIKVGGVLYDSNHQVWWKTITNK